MLDLSSLNYLFVLGIIGWFTYKVYIWPYYISPLRKIPGPPSESPIYGNFKTILVEEVNITYTFKFDSLNSYYQPTYTISTLRLVNHILDGQKNTGPL